MKGLKKPEANSHHRNLRIYLEGENNLTVIMEPDILKDVVDGLIKNAIENTPDEGAVCIRLESSGQMLFIKIQDTGIGITEEIKPRYSMACTMLRKQTCIVPEDPTIFNAEKEASIFFFQGYMDNGSALTYR